MPLHWEVVVGTCWRNLVHHLEHDAMRMCMTTCMPRMPKFLSRFES